MNSWFRIVCVRDRQLSSENRGVAILPPAGRRLPADWPQKPSLFAAMVLLFACLSCVCQDVAAVAPNPISVTPDALKAKIADLDAASDMGDEAKTKLLELYRKALSNLQTANSNAQAAEDFRLAAATAPEQVQVIREAMEKAAGSPPESTLEVDPSTPLREVEQLLQKERADLAAVDAKRADLEKQLSEVEGRAPLIRQRLTETSEQQEEVSAQVKLPPPAADGPAKAEARRWVLETRSLALSTEIKMLDQELLSQPARVGLLKAERDRAAASVGWVGKRVKVLEQLVNRKREEDAKQATAKAEAIRSAAEGKHPSVVHLAEQNATLSEELSRTASRLNELAELAERTATQAREIETNFKRAQDATEIGGLTQELGHMLRRQQQSLPSTRGLRRDAKARKDQAAEISVRRLRHQEEEAQLRDLDAYVDEILSAAESEETPELREQLRELATDRKSLLETAIEEDDVYLRKLGELESVQSRLFDAISDYRGFLDEHLLWVRSTSLFQLHKLSTPPTQMWRIVSPDGWHDVWRTLVYQATHSPEYALLASVFGVLLWGRRRMIAVIRDLGARLGKPATDRFGYSLLALGLTLLAAAAWPLAAAGTGWQLKASQEATEFSIAVGSALLAVSIHFFHLMALRIACIPRGLGESHFGWREASLRLLRTELDRLSWIFLPAVLGTMLMGNLYPLDDGWIVYRLFFLVAIGSLAFAFYRLLHPRRGIAAGYLGGQQRQSFKHLYRVGYPLVVLFPLVLGVLSLMGYRYTAGGLTLLLLETLWFVVSLIFLAALSERWLLVTRRRLAYKEAMERREAELGERRHETAHLGVEAASPPGDQEPEVDVIALSVTSRKLITTAILLYGLFGLWFIWSDVFPALRILDQVTLWHQTVIVDGDVQVLPITLASLGRALLYAAITVLLAKQLPAVLEILLLQYTGASAGGRYTITTLTNYAIITSGFVLAFKTIGADWSQLQWLVAALGVGIGFGLQEIVANFISGIIILFERPIRIGDVVTVGDTDGTVARIRSRATTIRSWDGKELLVPNKEFITGRLLNWSLSDQATRIVLSVGIAYGSNVREVMRLLEEAARENENVLDDPAPSVIFETFGDNSLGLLLRCFVASADLRYPTISSINEAINDKLSAADVVIAFPQMDLHLDTSRPLQVELRTQKVVSRNGDNGEVAGRSIGEN